MADKETPETGGGGPPEDVKNNNSADIAPQPDFQQTLDAFNQALKPIKEGLDGLGRTIQSHMQTPMPTPADTPSDPQEPPEKGYETALSELQGQVEELKGMIPPDFCEKWPHLCAGLEGLQPPPQPQDEGLQPLADEGEQPAVTHDRDKVVHMTAEEILACTSPECMALKERLAQGYAAPVEGEETPPAEEESDADEEGPEGPSRAEEKLQEPVPAGRDLI